MAILLISYGRILYESGMSILEGEVFRGGGTIYNCVLGWSGGVWGWGAGYLLHQCGV